MKHHHAHVVHHKAYHPPKALKKFGRAINHAAHVVQQKIIKPVAHAAPKIAKQVEQSVTAPFTTPWEVTRDVVHTTGGVITHTEDAIQGTVKSVFQSPTLLIIGGVALVMLLRR